MASDDKKAKTSPVPKAEPTSTKNVEGAPKEKSPPAADAAKAAGAEKTAEVSAGYSRGEGQKPVSQAYKDNWNAIYGKKAKKKKKR
ncbi:MAG: hypothetical protein HY244_14495 [Rhizobiales bacterium]|nr:hypothetical protein [Hyphomicrobiales bacterium]